MARDIPTQLVAIASLWPTTVLYGVNIVMFSICLVILVKRGRTRAPQLLIAAITLQFLLCTAHIVCLFGSAVSAFETVLPTDTAQKLVQTWGSPFNKWQGTIPHALNNFIGDLILIWRVYVLYGNNWWICILPLCLACAQLGCNIYSLVFTLLHPDLVRAALIGHHANSFTNTVVAGFSLMVVTQVLLTLLLAGKIFVAGRSLRKLSSTKESRYSRVMWMIVESGTALAVGDLVWVIIWKHNLSGLAQLFLSLLGQFAAFVSFSIIARVGLHTAFGQSTTMSRVSAAPSAVLEFRARTGGTGASATMS